MLCFSFTKRSIYFLSFTISLVICIIVYFSFGYSKINLYMHLENKNFKDTKKEESVLENNIQIQNAELEENTNMMENIVQASKEKIWRIEIPKIGLIADIAEGTTEDILNVYVGHFEETQKQNGNIGLAAHNRGYKVNYFNRLKELELGDEIIYTFDGISRTYEVESLSIIEDTNWKVLENTRDNRLTLITCVENDPSHRRCVQAIQK